MPASPAPSGPQLADFLPEVLVAAAALLGFAAFCRVLLRNPRGEVAIGFFWWLLQLYCRIFHRLRLLGLENVPRAVRVPGEAGEGRAAAAPYPLIVVANHTSGIDPILVQFGCEFEIRWMMARDMMEPRLARLWEWLRVIPVSRIGVGTPAGPTGGDAASAREALRHLKRGQTPHSEDGEQLPGVIGVFPEGRIARDPHPRGQILPFMSGAGFLVAKSGAKVLPAIITGTPRASTAWGSFWKTSRSTVRFLPVIDYASSGLKPDQITSDLHDRMEAALADELERGR